MVSLWPKSGAGQRVDCVFQLNLYFVWTFIDALMRGKSSKGLPTLAVNTITLQIFGSFTYPTLSIVHLMGFSLFYQLLDV